MSWIGIISTLLGVGLSLAETAINFFGNNKKAKQWLKDQADALYEKGWMTAAYIVDLESDRTNHINDKLDKLDEEESKKNETTND